jgi:hypothetical protein
MAARRHGDGDVGDTGRDQAQGPVVRRARAYHAALGKVENCRLRPPLADGLLGHEGDRADPGLDGQVRPDSFLSRAQFALRVPALASSRSLCLPTAASASGTTTIRPLWPLRLVTSRTITPTAQAATEFALWLQVARPPRTWPPRTASRFMQYLGTAE